MNKKIIVLQHNEGQLGNQLWLFSNLIAYTLEKNYDIDIWCFYQYSKFFETPFPKNKLIKILFYKTFPTFVFRNKNIFRAFRKVYRIFYKILVVFPIKILYSDKIVDSSKENIYLDDDSKKSLMIKKFETDPNMNIIYTVDWNFFAPPLLEKHREKIKEIFKPKKEILEKAEKQINDLRKKFKYIAGLHLRFKEPGDGEFLDEKFFWYVENKDLNYVKGLIEELLSNRGWKNSETAILIASNAKNLDLKVFDNLNVFCAKRHFIEDLFLLSKCDIILGCQSTFSKFASYLGEIPFVVLTKDKEEFLKELIKNS